MTSATNNPLGAGNNDKGAGSTLAQLDSAAMTATTVMVDGTGDGSSPAFLSDDYSIDLNDDEDNNGLIAKHSKRSLPLTLSSSFETDESSSYSWMDEEEQSLVEETGKEEETPKCCSHAAIIHRVHAGVIRLIQRIASVAIHHPRVCLISLSTLSVALLLTGVFTNFYIETENYKQWPPRGSLSLEHSEWLYKESHFNKHPLVMDLVIHKNGDNVLGQEGVDRVFQVLEIFTDLPGYKEGCALAELVGDVHKVGRCSIDSVADFWNESYAEFLDTVENDEDAISMLSQKTYPNGVSVDVDTIMGNAQMDDASSGLLSSAQSYLVHLGIPWSNATLDFEALALDRMLLLQEEWEQADEVNFVLEVQSYSSYNNEFLRSVVSDLWLLPLGFGIQALFTVFFAFGKWDRVHSRGLLGIGAVGTILLSLMTSYGILFICGVPFTTQTLMVPFLMIGIGLDDAFIIYGSYNRKSHIKDAVERVRSTIDDIGVSIFLTTMTSMLAFFLGSFSTIPAIKWLCLYIFVCVLVDFIFQITFFLALIVLDERRIQDNRMDFCTCITVAETSNGICKNEEVDARGGKVTAPAAERHSDNTESVHPADRLMQWWANQLLKRPIQVIAMIVFAAMAAGSIYCTTQLEQQFDSTSLVPVDSYLKPFYKAIETYSTRDGLAAHVYFRGVDQSDPEVQAQMESYIDDLVAEGNVETPTYFWLRDFKAYTTLQANDPTSSFQYMSFVEQMNQFLSEPRYKELYQNDVGRSDSNAVMETRCAIHIKVDVQSASTDMLKGMRSISATQPINQDSGDWKFFTYSDEYHLYEYYDSVVKELIYTSISSVVAVGLIAFFFVPHWTAVFFVVPCISVLYINMLGYLYLSGSMINGISFVTLIMSIGLMVDYIMHILMRYFESEGTREDRIKETMSSMGASIFLGASSTFLGIMCLSLSTCDVLQDVFVSVVGLIVFGVLNGLVFLPVVLALVGPEDRMTKRQQKGKVSLTSINIHKSRFALLESEVATPFVETLFWV